MTLLFFFLECARTSAREKVKDVMPMPPENGPTIKRNAYHASLRQLPKEILRGFFFPPWYMLEVEARSV